MKKQVTALLCLSLLVLPACNAGPETTGSSEPAPTSEAAPQAMPIEYSDSGYAEAPIQADADMYAMDTVMHFRVYGRDKAQAGKAIEDAFAEIKRLDALMSTNQKQSELAILNRTGTTTLSKDNAYLLKRAMEINAQTDGNFNIAVYPLVKAWGFTTQKYNVPSEETITKLLPLTEVKDVHFDEKSGKVSLAKKNMGLDFGGIAKGYASQRLMD
ncbi:MAG: FAD:protein FMN transferase, partial [Clostridia bacterium]|nr:FAD:protein FMN transferase [Clostridia bacterium]